MMLSILKDIPAQYWSIGRSDVEDSYLVQVWFSDGAVGLHCDARPGVLVAAYSGPKTLETLMDLMEKMMTEIWNNHHGIKDG
jgi:hypothetical protein